MILIAERDKPIYCVQDNKTKINNKSYKQLTSFSNFMEFLLFDSIKPSSLIMSFGAIGCSIVMNCKDYQFYLYFPKGHQLQDLIVSVGYYDINFTLQ